MPSDQTQQRVPQPRSDVTVGAETVSESVLPGSPQGDAMPLSHYPRVLAAAFHSVPNSIVITDRNGTILWVNAAFTRLTGYSASEAIGNTPRILRSSAQDKTFYEKLWSTILSGEIWQGELVNRRKDGTLFSEEMTITPVFSSKGEIENFVAIKQDTTVRKRYVERLRLYTLEMARARAEHQQHARELSEALEKLRKSEATFRLLFNAIPQAVYVYDRKNLQFLEVNEASIKRYGYSREELLHMTVNDIRPAEEVPRSSEPLKANQSSNLVTSGCKHQGRDGRIFDVEISACSLQFGGVQAMLSIAQDVTERNRLEVELRHGQKLQAVGGLAAGIAHEMNTPIQFVGDNVRFLKDGFSGVRDLLGKYQALEQAAASGSVTPALLEEVHETYEACDMEYLLEEVPKALSQALDGTARVADIVRAIKEFSHPDRGEKVSADINAGLQTTLIVARNELKYCADVEVDFGDLPPVLCYPGHLNQVFLNLLVNAAHAVEDVMKSTGKKGKIRVESRVDHDFVCVKIIDTGTGIPEHIRNRIFEPFFTTKEVGRGTGQGLALARSIVTEKHGGTITFESQVGVGTAFTIRLPIARRGQEK